MRALFVLAALSAIASANPRTWSEAKFESNVKEVLAEHFPGGKVTTLDTDEYRITPAKGDVFEIRFAKAHAMCRDAWSDCDAAVAQVMRALDQGAHPGKLEVSQLRVVLRATGKVAEVRKRTPRVTTRPFSSDAEWLLAADMPDIIRLDIAPEELKLTTANAWKTATAASKPVNVVSAEAGPFLVYQNDYAPSSLLFPELLEAAVRARHPDAKGRLLAVCPEENIVLYTIGGPAQVKDLRAAAESGSKDSQMPLSTAVMEWRAGGWHELAK